MAGSTRASIALGERRGRYRLRARRVAADRVHHSSRPRQADLEKNAERLRRKDLFDGRSFNTTRVELRRGGETLTFEKSKGKDGKDVWKNAAGKDVDTAKVEDMLTKLVEHPRAAVPGTSRSSAEDADARRDA